VAAKITRTVRDLGLSRFDLKYSNGTLPHEALMKSIELFGTKVMPLVRAEVDFQTHVSPQSRYDAGNS
jgi:hypothetical protein